MKEERRIRISALYMQEVSKMIQTELKDPRIGFVTVTDCSVALDFSVAKVKVSVLGGDKELKLTLHGLNSSRKFIQSEVSRRLRLRSTPQLSFEFDPGVQKSIRISQLLREQELGRTIDPQLPYVSSVLPEDEDDASKDGQPQPQVDTPASFLPDDDDDDQDEDDDVEESEDFDDDEFGFDDFDEYDDEGPQDDPEDYPEEDKQS